MNKIKCIMSLLVTLLFPTVIYGNVTFKSPIGGEINFSEEKKGDNYEPNSWGRITFTINDHLSDLSRNDRYYIEDGTSKLSPSGAYLILNSVSGDYVEQDNGTKKFSERAYCSVIDLRSGCIVSDWDGEACSYNWKKNEDILSNSEAPDADVFDFLSMKPNIRSMKNALLSKNENEVKNILRCNPLTRDNLNSYQEFLKSEDPKSLISKGIIIFLNSIPNEIIINTQAALFSWPEENYKTKAYLIAGDKVKVISESEDHKWLHIGYISNKRRPLIAWIKSDILVD